MARTSRFRYTSRLKKPLDSDSVRLVSVRISRSFQVQGHGRRDLEIVLHDVGESGDGGAVQDAVVGRPADVDDVGLDDRSVSAEPRQRLNSADCTDENLKMGRVWLKTFYLTQLCLSCPKLHS